MNCIQILGVPVLFFYKNYCTWFITIIEGEGIGFYLQPTQPLFDFLSNPNHIQPLLMHMIAFLANPTDLRKAQKLAVGFFHRTD